MPKRITLTYSVTYTFKGDLLKEYEEQLHGHRDTKSQRKWFAIDRFIGHDNLRLFDRKGKLKIHEESI